MKVIYQVVSDKDGSRSVPIQCPQNDMLKSVQSFAEEYPDALTNFIFVVCTIDEEVNQTLISRLPVITVADFIDMFTLKTEESHDA